MTDWKAFEIQISLSNWGPCTFVDTVTPLVIEKYQTKSLALESAEKTKGIRKWRRGITG